MKLRVLGLLSRKAMVVAFDDAYIYITFFPSLMLVVSCIDGGATV